MAATSAWRSIHQTYIRLPRLVRRLPALVVGACLGWMFADLVLLRGDDASQPARGAKAGEPKKVKPAAKFSNFPDWVGGVAVAADNRTAAAGSFEVVKLLDLTDRKEIASLTIQAGMIQAVAFSPDGKQLAAGGYQDVSLWNVETREKIRSLPDHRGQVTSVAFSPDGALVATGCEDELVRVFEVSTGVMKWTLEGHAQPITGVAFNSDGSRLASSGSDLTRPTKTGAVKVWDVSTGKEVLSAEPHRRAVSGVAFSRDDKDVATASHDETVQITSVADGKVTLSYEEHARVVNSVVFLPDGKHAASASGGRNVGMNEAHVWDLKGKAKAVLEGHEGPVMQVATTPDGRRLVTGSFDKTVCVWEIAAVIGLPQEKPAVAANQEKPMGLGDKELRAGIIGLDTSHAIAFTGLLNAEKPRAELAGCKIVAAYPKGSPDIESSVSRVPKYIEDVKKQGVEIVDSIDSLLEKVDVVFLETNDGRPHLEQLLPCLKNGKPTFIDKPIAASLADAVAIFEAAREHKVPVFSSSSLRFSAGAQAIRNGKIGDVLGCDAYSPCSLEKTHPDLFWYGIHGVETLFTVMGPGCESVTRVHAPDYDLVVGSWKEGRIGTFRGIRSDKGSGYGGTAFGSKGIEPIGKYDGYEPLLVEIVKFFRTGVAPVSEQETLEIYAFMEAADESKRQGGVPVKLETVLAKAREAGKKE